jgi:hypothetical protein
MGTCGEIEGDGVCRDVENLMGTKYFTVSFSNSLHPAYTALFSRPTTAQMGLCSDHHQLLVSHCPFLKLKVGLGHKHQYILLDR